MSTLSIRLPDSLHDRIRELSKRDGVSINQFISIAAAEKVSALLTLEYLESRASKASREKYLEALRLVPDSEPSIGDEIEP